jgi:glutaredoxin-like protein
MAIFNDQVREQLTKTLIPMVKRVNILYFTQEIVCGVCDDVDQFLKEFCALSDKLNCTVFDFVKEAEKVKFYGVERVPAIIILDENDNDTRMRFYGVPAGYEINSFILALFEISGVKSDVPADIVARIKKISKPVHIQVFVSLTCPYCPDAVHMAHRIAIENNFITADMVDTSVFTPLAIKYNVTSVPKTVINENIELVGLQPIDAIVEAIEKAASA